MRRLVLTVLTVFLLASPALAADLTGDLTRELKRDLPAGAEDILELGDLSSGLGFTSGVIRLLEKARREVGDILRQRVRGAAAVLLVVTLCAAVENFYQGEGKAAPYLPMAGALSVTALTAGSLDSLIGLGAETIGELSLFSKALLPTLAAAAAASGAVATASFQQVSTVFLVDLLLNLIHGLLMPLVYLYIGALTAGACMAEDRLAGIAEGLKRIITWILTSALLLFTVYLSVARVVTGAADGAAVKVTKAAISGAVPVVGGIIAEAAETVLAGAGMVKNSLGVFGLLAILAACIYPFLQLGIQYLLFKLTAFLAGALGAKGLRGLIDGLGGAFGLVLGMTGSCALLMLVSVLSSLAAVTP